MKVYLLDAELDDVRTSAGYVPAVLAELDGLHVVVTVREVVDGPDRWREADRVHLRIGETDIPLPSAVADAVRVAAQVWLDDNLPPKEEPEHDPADRA